MENKNGFLKEGKGTISKLVINHFAMCVFGLIVIIASNRAGEVLKHLSGALAIIVYLCLLYTVMWEKGAADKVKIDGGRMKKCKLTGLYLWLIAHSVNILISLLIEILRLTSLTDAHGVFVLISRYINAIYLSITASFDFSGLYIIILIPGLIVCTISYILGVNGYRCLFPEPKYEKNRKIK